MSSSTFVRNLAFDIPSAADISPTGREIIIRQEEFARLWTRTNGQSISTFAGHRAGHHSGHRHTDRT
jgi:hypothetical protein